MKEMNAGRGYNLSCHLQALLKSNLASVPQNQIKSQRQRFFFFPFRFYLFGCTKSLDREAWWATVHGVEKSWTQLKQLSLHVPDYMRRMGMSTYWQFLETIWQWVVDL